MTYGELNHPDETTSFVALCDEIPVGFCTLKLKEEFRADLGPWLADVVVAPKHQKQGIGKMLVDVAVGQAKELGFEKLYQNITSALEGGKSVWMNLNLIL